jgi:predicted N-acyltransferase
LVNLAVAKFISEPQTLEPVELVSASDDEVENATKKMIIKQSEAQSSNQRLMGIVNKLDRLEENQMVFKELVINLTDTCTFKAIPYSFSDYIQNLSDDKRRTIEKIRKDVSLVPLD